MIRATTRLAAILVIAWGLVDGDSAGLFAQSQVLPDGQRIDKQPIGGQQIDSLRVGPNAGDSNDHDLSTGDFSSRHRATMQLWKDREFTRGQVQQAARDDDPEKSLRAKWILQQWRKGVLPDTPPKLSRLLSDPNDPTTVIRLLEAGEFSAAAVAVEESMGTIAAESIMQRVAPVLRVQLPVYVGRATANGSMASLLKLMDLTADTGELALARILMMQELGVPVDPKRLLPRSASAWTPKQRQTVTISLLAAMGEMQQAIELAQDSLQPEVYFHCLMLDDQWNRLAGDAHKAALDDTVSPLSQIRSWCWVMIAADRSGNEPLFNDAFTALLKFDSDDEEAGSLRWKCLALHGRIDQAIDLLANTQATQSAVLCLASSRPGKAFDVLEVDQTQLDASLHAWIAAAAGQQVSSGLPQACSSADRLIALMRVLASLGDDDAAWIIAKGLSEVPAGADGYQLRSDVFRTLKLVRKSDWNVRLAISALDNEEEISDDTFAAIVGTLGDASQETVQSLLEALEKRFPKWDLVKRIQIAGQLLAGELPENFDLVEDLDALFRFAMQPRSTRSLQQRFDRSSGVRANLQWAKMFSSLGRPGLASECLMTLAESGDVDSILQLAQQAMLAGRFVEADGYYSAVYNAIAMREGNNWKLIASSSGKSGSFIEHVAYSLVGMWTAAARQGDVTRADVLETQLNLSLCGASQTFRGAVLEYLDDLGEQGTLDAPYEGLLSANWIDAAGDKQSLAFYEQAREYALLMNSSDPSRAAKWFDIAITQLIHSDNFYSSAYATLPVYVHRWRLQSAIRKNDLLAAEKAIDRLLHYDPVDIDLAERILPDVRDSGMGQLANETLNRILQNTLTHTSLYPLDAVTRNNAAWVAAVNERHLDIALQLAREATTLQPDSAIYRDTLAEVKFLLGEASQALKIEQDCLLDDPDQWHLHQQIDRFQLRIDADRSK